MGYRDGRVVQGFDPVVGDDAGVIILGTLPGGESLRLRQYYADGRNAFWFVVEALFAIRSKIYDQRTQGLIQNRIAIWDVLERAERNGSQDHKIVRGTEVPNDFTEFFRHHPSIRTVFFNGAPAEKYFRDLVLPHLSLGGGNPLLHPALPSTSGGNTHSTREEKINGWRAVQRALTAFGTGIRRRNAARLARSRLSGRLGA